MLMNYGQPLGGIMQFAYIVEDIERSIRHYVETHKIGPWFLAGPFVPPACLYRGKPSAPQLSLALAFSGHMMIELIQQHDPGPSVYRETRDRVGYGFHHVGIVTDQFDTEIDRYARLGYEMAFYDVLQGGRIAYFDTTRDFPGMTELIEFTPTAERRQSRVHWASLGWDGSHPIRKLMLDETRGPTG